MFGTFARASVYGNLSPLERAVLKFIELVVGGALLAGLQAALPLLNHPNLASIQWVSVAHTFLAAFLLALAMSVLKYAKAFGDPPLPTALPTAPSVPVAVPVAVPAAMSALPAVPVASLAVPVASLADAPACATASPPILPAQPAQSV